jgi:hypothetical protein
MRSSWPVRFLLPTVQVLAEGGWLAVVYAAVQAFSGTVPAGRPDRAGALAWMGLASGRRTRWQSAGAEAIGLPLLMVVGGAVGWLLAPEVRTLLVNGRGSLAALGTHPAGWIGAIAVWRGDAHRLTDDDDQMAGQLLRWAVPGSPSWLIGHQLTSGAAEIAFTSPPSCGTIVFTGSAFTAMGLARLEAVRQATGSDWRASRHGWLVLEASRWGSPPSGSWRPSSWGCRQRLVALIGPLRILFLILPSSRRR